MKPYPLAPLNHLTVPFSFTDATPFAAFENLISAARQPVERRLCAAGQESPLSQQASSCSPSVTIRTTQAWLCRGQVPTALKKAPTECALRDERRELGIIFRNSGFCKAICFPRRSSLRQWNPASCNSRANVQSTRCAKADACLP